MVSQAQAAHVTALVIERHNEVKRAFDALLNAYAAGDKAQIITANGAFRTSLYQLKAVVAAQHWPQWLKSLVQSADKYATHHSHGHNVWRAHLDAAIDNAKRLEKENWSFVEEENLLFDIDSIVDQAVSDHNVIGVYDKVILLLTELIGSGEVDSLRALQDLGRLTANLRKARDGSFSSKVFNWRFARRFLPNLITSYVKRNGVTGPIIEAFEQTATELDVSLDAAKDQIGSQILSAAASALRTEAAGQITGESLLFLEYQPSKTGVGAVLADNQA